MKVVILFFVLSLFSSLSVAQNQVHVIDPLTGAQSWEVQRDGVVFYLNQLLPDQLRAFYSSRGFTQKQIEAFAQSCVFMTVLRNESALGVVRYQLSDWRIITPSQKLSIKPLDEWLQYHKGLNVSQSALIAFRWAQFPQEQEYEPGGDWNQGMLSLGANQGEFDVVAHWTLQNKPFQITLEGVRCAL